MATDKPTIIVYPVGLFLDVARLRSVGISQIRIGLGYFMRQIKRRNWRAVRNYFNGFLAEVNYPPSGLRHTCCGKGWTRKAAARDLGYRLWLDNRED